MAQSTSSTLLWPNENAASIPENAGVLSVPGSNILLDLHGDPIKSGLVLYSDGNHHMALEEALQTFLAAHPDAVDIFYATTPPRVIIDALETGVLVCGNLSLPIRPNAFICPSDIMGQLSEKGLIHEHVPFAKSAGLAILVAKGNPKNIREASDMLRDDVRLALSNPVSETASFAIYERAILKALAGQSNDSSELSEILRSSRVIKSQVIHHREIPQLIASGLADASVVYHHLALRYTRIFPEHFELIPLIGPEGGADFLTTYHIALIGDGGRFGRLLIEHFLSEEVSEIYVKHGLSAAQ